MNEYKRKRLAWILTKYPKTLREIIKLTDEYKSKYDIENEELGDSEEELALWQKHHDAMDKILVPFMDEWVVSKHVALKYFQLAYKIAQKRMIKQEKTLKQ